MTRGLFLFFKAGSIRSFLFGAWLAFVIRDTNGLSGSSTIKSTCGSLLCITPFCLINDGPCISDPVFNFFSTLARGETGTLFAAACLSECRKLSTKGWWDKF